MPSYNEPKKPLIPADIDPIFMNRDVDYSYKHSSSNDRLNLSTQGWSIEEEIETTFAETNDQPKLAKAFGLINDPLNNGYSPYSNMNTNMNMKTMSITEKKMDMRNDDDDEDVNLQSGEEKENELYNDYGQIHPFFFNDQESWVPLRCLEGWVSGPSRSEDYMFNIVFKNKKTQLEKTSWLGYADCQTYAIRELNEYLFTQFKKNAVGIRANFGKNLNENDDEGFGSERFN